MKRTAVLFTTHVINQAVRAHFSKLRDELPRGYDLFLFFDEERISERGARKVAGSAILPHQNQGWRRFKRPGRYFSEKIPGNEDGHILNAIARLEGYEDYWYMEYDVAFSGDWAEFFQGFECSRSDLLAVNITPREVIPDWPLWKSVEIPEADGLRPTEWVRTHLAISRHSRLLFETLTNIYSEGWAGHAEALIGTLALQNGLTVEDIGGDGPYVKAGNNNKYYRSTPTNNSLAPGTFVFRPSRDAVGDEPNLLWHPIKRPSRFDWDNDSGPVGRLLRRLMARQR